ncbi:MAG: EAL domain-containing protein, partial [Lachnospiraceae bacterium]|nr:EAL domain-containing protein [Lachnospiraceae bacterium]
MEKYVFSTLNRSVLEKLKQPFAVYQLVDKRVVTLLLSDGFLELFGYDKREEAIYDMDNDMYKDTHPDDVARIANAALEFATGEGKYEVIYRTRKKDSSDYTVVHAMGQHVYTEDGVRLAQVWYTDEGTYVEGSPVDGLEVSKSFSNALHELSLIKASQYDYLTGLPSMTYFFELAEAGKETILKNGGQPVLMYMDFSGMKFFNTKHGFSEGDKLLKSFARTLIQKFSNENCCRIGADHFAVFAEEEGLEDKLTAIFRENSELYESKSLPVHVGIYPWRIEDVPVSMACDRAKFACKELKGTYSSAFNHYNIEMRNDVDQRQYIKENIDRAIKERWIKVYYQPIVRAVNLRVCDEEALARWIDPEKGFMSPAAFIPALEESGQIYKLDLCILEQVLEKLGHQKDAGLFIVPQSINLSRADFDACDIVEEIRKRVDAAKVKREYITIEITES